MTLSALLLALLASLARFSGSTVQFLSKGRSAASVYECGFAPFQHLVSSHLFLFYRLAIFFVVFEAELIFLYPWAGFLVPAAALTPDLLPFLAPLGFVSALVYGFWREVEAEALDI